MIEDIEVAYLGTTIKVSHSLHKPDEQNPGKIRYTFHLPAREVTLWQLQDQSEHFYWVEIPGGKTMLAAELGEILEDFYND